MFDLFSSELPAWAILLALLALWLVQNVWDAVVAVYAARAEETETKTDDAIAEALKRSQGPIAWILKAWRR